MPKKSKVQNLGTEYVSLPTNPDKKHHESWVSKSGKTTRKIGNIPRPYRAIFCSQPSRGKTFTAQQLILRAKPHFDALYVVSAYTETEEWDPMDPTGILPEIPDPSFWDEHKDDRVLLILEDFEVRNRQDEHALSSLFRWCSSHCCKGITVYLLYQDWFRIPIIARHCADFFVLWSNVDLSSRKLIERRVGLEDGQLTELFKLCKKPTDSICIDKTPNSPYPLRFNLFKPIKDVLMNNTDVGVERAGAGAFPD